MKWLDSRLEQPSSNSFNKYFVYFLYCETTFLGFADWMPEDGYKTGKWQNVTCTNGNPLSPEAKVLYWMPHPKKPELGEKND